jgi:hypothetical protein
VRRPLRDALIEARVSRVEHAHFRAIAYRAGLSISELVREGVRSRVEVLERRVAVEAPPTKG